MTFEKSVPAIEPQREIFAATVMGGEDASRAYNLSVGLHFAGALDMAALQTALTQLVDRHEALRGFFSSDGQTLFVRPQSSQGGGTPQLPLTDLSQLAESEREARLMALRAQDADTAFDLENGPLLRAQVVKLASDVHHLLLTAHHIAVDGWSWDVILRELGALYAAAHANVDATLDSAPSFSQYALDMQAAESDASRAEAQRYWLKQFASTPSDLDLPTDRRRPAVKTYASRRVDLVLPKDLTDKVKKTGAKLGASFFVTMLAGLAALLHRLTRQDDLVIGIPAAGQVAAGEFNLVGHAVNTLPLRFTMADGMSFAQLVKAAQETMLDGVDHQQLSFGALVQRLALKRDPSRLPLMNVLFNLGKFAQGSELGFTGLDVSVFWNPRHFENFELSINISELPGETVVEVQYNSDLFDHETVHRWLASLQTLLAFAADAPDTRLDRLNMLTPQEVVQIESWNRTVAPYERTALVHELFETQADKSKEKVALVFEGQSLSYGDLDARANQIAHALREAGVTAGSLVGLCAERSTDMVAAFLGILKAGGAYVPLDPGYPKDRLGFMIEDSQMPVLLTTASLKDTLGQHCAKVITLETTHAAPRTRIEGKATDAEQPAYIIYTSGSTGKPKGVMVPHRAVSNFITTIHQQPGLSAGDVMLAVTTLSFDIAVLELHVSLCAGAKIIVASRDEAQDGAALLRLTEQATIMQATPSTWRLLIAAGWRGRPHPANGLPAFKALVGGEALPQDLAEQLIERTGELWNMYGPTETTVWSTCQRVERGQPIRIGKPMANTTLEVLDANLARQPIGIIGELHLGGDGVTLGYLHRPELSAERFIDDPFRSGQKLYKTGDLARWMSDGTVDYLGRNDNQVKVRGYRIELGEIEATLARHPAIAVTAVIVREDVAGDARIVAYVVPRDDTDYTDTELRKHLRKTLPDYMVPQHFVELDRLPLTPNGKVDRKALPAPAGAGADARVVVAPRTDAERMLAELFQDTLKLGGVSVHDNFFDLGGHSLLCFQVIAKVQEKTGVRLNPRLMLLNSLEQTAAFLMQEQAGGTAGSVIQEDAKSKPLPGKPVGFAQKMLQKIGLQQK